MVLANGHTLIEHVSSVSKWTMASPPLAISALFGGRNRATTVAVSVRIGEGDRVDRISLTLDSIPGRGIIAPVR